MKNNMRPVHPGEILKEDYLVPLGMSANALAIELKVPANRIQAIVNQKRGITIDTAMRLALYFGGDEKSWMNLQTTYDIKVAQKDKERLAKEITPHAA